MTKKPDSGTSEALTMGARKAAKLIGIGIDQVYNGARKGEIPSVRIGDRVLILTRPLKAMLQAD